MKIQSFANFNRDGSGTIDSPGTVAVGIAPGSEVDTLFVDGRRLGVGALMPARHGSELRAVRGFRTLTANIIVTGIKGEDARAIIGGGLQLLLYEACDALVPPGPRAPITQGRMFPTSDLPVVGGLHAYRAIRLPCSGRRRWRLAVRGATGTAPTTSNFALYLNRVQWLDRESCVRPSTFEPSIFWTQTLWTGAHVWPSHVADQCNGNSSSANQGLFWEGSFDGSVSSVQGIVDAELDPHTGWLVPRGLAGVPCDEFEVLMQTTEGTASRMAVFAEVYGEASL